MFAFFSLMVYLGQSQKNKILKWLSLSFLVIGFLLFTVWQSGGYTTEQFFFNIIIVAVLPAFGTGMVYYLERPKLADEEIRKKSSMQTDSFLSNPFDALINNIKGDKTKLLSEIENYNQFILIKESFSKTESRIKSEIESLGRRSNLNLVIGLITTLIGIGILASSVFFTQVAYKNTLEFFSAYIPKATMALFIELFSFYFLALYQANLREIKFYQNELTSIEIKLFSYQSIFFLNDIELLKKATEFLLATERNVILKKDETTLDIEKAKLELESNKDILSKLVSIKDLLFTKS